MPLNNTADCDGLTNREYELFGLQPPVNDTPSWLDVPMASIPRFPRTRRYGTSDQHKRRDRNVYSRGRFDKYDVECNREVRAKVLIDPIDDELDTDHEDEMDRKHPNYGDSRAYWYSRLTPKQRREMPFWEQESVLDSAAMVDEATDDVADESCDPDCHFCGVGTQLADWEIELLSGEYGDVEMVSSRLNDEYQIYDDDYLSDHMPDDDVEDPREYPGDWMLYISSRDEKARLAEAFDGWGYKVTTRP